MGLPPSLRGEEAPEEELAGLGPQLFEAVTGDVDRDNAGAFPDHGGDPQPVSDGVANRQGDPVAEQMLINGGWPVRGIIKHDRRSKKCSLEVAG